MKNKIILLKDNLQETKNETLAVHDKNTLSQEELAASRREIERIREEKENETSDCEVSF